MKTKKIVGLFAATVLTTLPLVGCGDDEECYDSQGNQVSCDSTDVDVHSSGGYGDGSHGSGG